MVHQSIEEVLREYDIGETILIEQFKRASYSQNSYKITTSKDSYFLKQYKNFQEKIEKGLRLASFLNGRGFPAVKVFKTNSGDIYTQQDNEHFALFEYFDLEENITITGEESYELGSTLAKFHVLSKDFPIKYKSKGYAIEKFDERVNMFAKQLEKHIPNLMVLREKVDKLLERNDLPEGICHHEFVLDHVRFQNGKIVKVIDWDLVKRDILLLDLGTTMVTSIEEGELNYDLLLELIRGYDKERPLTDLERQYLHNALCFGVYKFLLWSLEPDAVEENGISQESMKQIKLIISISENEFHTKVNIT